MSSVFAPGKGRTFTLNFLDIRVSSICPNIESPVTRHVPSGYAFVLTLPVLLLLVLSFISLLLIFPWITGSSLFLLQSVITMLEFNMYSWWRVFLFPLTDHLFFYFEQFSFRSLFLTYLQKHSCWALEYWNLEIVVENVQVNFLDCCTVVLLFSR